MLNQNTDANSQNADAEEILGEVLPTQENQDERPNLNRDYTAIQRKLFVEFAELFSTTSLGAGVGYLTGGLIRVFVDLAQIGINEMHKQSEEERVDKYMGINHYTTSGLSIGVIAGSLAWLCVNELIRQRNEGQMELMMVQDNVNNESNNFNGALNREIVSINVNGDQEPTISAVITVNGDDRSDFGSQSGRSIMILGEGNLSGGGLDLNSNGGNVNLRENVNTTRSRGASLEPIAENYISNEVALENPNQSIVNPNQQSLASPRGVIINIRNSQAVEEGGIAPLQRGFVLRVVQGIEGIKNNDPTRSQ